MAAEKETTSLEQLDRQSLTSLGLGTLVVIIIGLLIFNYFSKIKQAPPLSEEAVTEETLEKVIGEEMGLAGEGEEAKPNFEFQPTDLPKEHTVAKGEHLWGLAKRYYNNGYQWVEIARANNLANADLIKAGDILTIPASEIAEKTEASEETAKAGVQVLGSKIKGEEYTVQEGDNLCKIGLRAYGECAQGWEVARANNLTNPNLIYPGIVLVIPRA